MLRYAIHTAINIQFVKQTKGFQNQLLKYLCFFGFDGQCTYEYINFDNKNPLQAIALELLLSSITINQNNGCKFYS